MVSVLRSVVACLLIAFSVSSLVVPVYAASAPTAPQNVTVTAGPGLIGEATVSWDPPVFDGGSPITHYVVWGVDGGYEWEIARTDADTTSIVVKTETPIPGPERIAVSAVTAVGDGQHAHACLVWSPYGPLDGTVWCR